MTQATDSDTAAVEGDASTSRTQAGAGAYFFASVVTQVSALVRYTVLARLLGPEQLGLAATIILTAQFFDSLSDSGADRFLIQHKDGDTVHLQQLVQLMLSTRGLLTAIALVVLAIPLASLYRSPALSPGIMILALSPLIGGFIHMDMRRFQRRNDFRAESANLLVSEVLMTVTMLIAAYFLRNFTAIIYGLIARSISVVVISRLVAKRPYKLGLSPAHTRDFALFAAPLMLNGLVLFLGGQGDRIMVGSRLGPVQLGEYSAVSLLAYYPTAIIARYLANIHLPRIAENRTNGGVRLDRIDVLEGQTLSIAIIMLVGFAIVGPTAVAILFGPKFAQTGLTFGLIGTMQISRFIRLWPTTVALAHGRSGVVLATNIVRLGAFPAALVGLVVLGGIGGIAVGFIAGDLSAQLVGIIMTSGSRAALLRSLSRVALFCGAASAVIGWEVALVHPAQLMLGALTLFTLLIGSLIAFRERTTLYVASQFVSQITRLPRRAS